MAFTLDFGDFTPEDVSRVQKELQQFGQPDSDPTGKMNAVSRLAVDFGQFVKQVLERNGLLTTERMLESIGPVSFEGPADAKPETLMRQAWNQRAGLWAVVESPHTYLMTMQTLMEHLRLTHMNQRREYFLSIGSGPGLYEIFLYHICRMLPEGRRVRIVCADIATEMSRKQKEIQKSVSGADGRHNDINNAVFPVTQDMSSLAVRSGSIDQIICNNSLQWAADWKQAIREMSRVMKPNGLGWLYLFVHLHPMVVHDENGKVLFSFGEFTDEELLDELEANRFEVHHMRQISGSKGTGQAGGNVNRRFVKARFVSDGEFTHWREKKVRTALSGVAFKTT